MNHDINIAASTLIGSGYELAIRPPGPWTATLRRDLHHLCVHLGKGEGRFAVAGASDLDPEMPARSWSLFPADSLDEPAEVNANLPGWTVQITFCRWRIASGGRILATTPSAAPAHPPEFGTELLGSSVRTGDFGPFVVDLCDHLRDLIKGADASLLARRRSGIDALIEVLVNHLIMESQTVEETQPRGVKAAPERLEPVLAHIADHLGEKLRLGDLAEIAGISVYHFARVFRATTGQSSREYIVERRVEQASRMLRQTDMPLAQIAYDCGFSSQSHMNEAFRRVVGTPPGRMRKAG